MATPVHTANNRHTDNWWLEDIAMSLAAGGSGSSGGVYNATQPTLTDGQSTAVATDNKGNTQVVGNVASAATDSGAPVKVGGKYNSTPPTFTNGQRGDFQIEADGSLRINMSTLLSGEDQTVNVLKVEQRYAYAPINTATTTTVKSGAGHLHAITILGGTAGAITVYDNTTGTGTTICPTFTPGSVSTPITLQLNVGFSTGLTIVTAAATVLTVSYR